MKEQSGFRYLQFLAATLIAILPTPGFSQSILKINVIQTADGISLIEQVEGGSIDAIAISTRDTSSVITVRSKKKRLALSLSNKLMSGCGSCIVTIVLNSKLADAETKYCGYIAISEKLAYLFVSK